MNENPNPGSDEAVSSGCKCPVMDNFHGRGIPMTSKDGTPQTAFWINAECPLHGTRSYAEVAVEQQGN